MDREVSFDGSSADGSPAPGHGAIAREPSPDEAAAFADQMEHLLNSLDHEERQLVTLKLEGLESPAIAERLGCSERTVRRLLQRVRTRWERELGRTLTGT